MAQGPFTNGPYSGGSKFDGLRAQAKTRRREGAEGESMSAIAWVEGALAIVLVVGWGAPSFPGPECAMILVTDTLSRLRVFA